MENENQQINSNEEVKTFTQEDVNRIVSERLAKEKAKYETASKTSFQDKEAELSKREKDVALREMRATAKEILMNKKLPMELLDVVNFNSEEDMNKSIEILNKTYSPRGAVCHYTPEGGETPYSDPIRAAMGLNKKG